MIAAQGLPLTRCHEGLRADELSDPYLTLSDDHLHGAAPLTSHAPDPRAGYARPILLQVR